MVLFQARPVDPLNHDVAIVDERGRPTPQFMRQWALARTFAVETQAIITYGAEWDDIVGKPATFPPSPHTHDTADVISGTFASARISQGSVTQYQGVLAIGWAQLTGVPATFPPSAHQHDWADVTGEPATYAPSAHTHPASEITAGAFAAGNYVFPANVTLETLRANSGIGVGQAPLDRILLYLDMQILSIDTIQRGAYVWPQGNANGTAELTSFEVGYSSSSSVYTLTHGHGLYVRTPNKGAGSTITNSYGIRILDQPVGVNNYAIHLSQSVGYAIYHGGAAPSYFGGLLSCNVTGAGGVREIKAGAVDAALPAGKRLLYVDG